MKVDLSITICGDESPELALLGAEHNKETIDLCLVTWMPRPANGQFLVSQAVNKGFRLCRSQLRMHLDGDTYLAPGSIESMINHWRPGVLVQPQIEVYSALKARDRDEIAIATGEEVELEFGELINDAFFQPVPRSEPWNCVRGASWLCAAEDFISIGGWSEEMTEYGLQDQEFAARWLGTFGTHSIINDHQALAQTWEKPRSFERVRCEDSINGTVFNATVAKFFPNVRLSEVKREIHGNA